MKQSSFAVILISVLSVSGCAHHRVVVAEPNPTVRAPATTNSTVIVFNGGQYQTVVDCDTNLLDEVSIKQNIGQTLLTVATLGSYWPLTIEYRCAKMPSDFGSTDD